MTSDDARVVTAEAATRVLERELGAPAEAEQVLASNVRLGESRAYERARGRLADVLGGHRRAENEGRRADMLARGDELPGLIADLERLAGPFHLYE